MILEVNQEHINNQKNGALTNQCAIHDALYNKYPGKFISCQLECIEIGEEKFLTSPALKAWQVNNAYHPERAKPITLYFNLIQKYVELDWENKLTEKTLELLIEESR